MKRRTFLKSGSAGLVIVMIPTRLMNSFNGKPAEETLESGFINPPDTARVRTWWHWMNGNESEIGITLDLEAIKKAGAGGVHMFEISDQITGPVRYGTTENIRLKEHAVREADRLGLEFTMHNCPGFTSSAGPWITPDRSMQQIAWSESHINGGRKVNVNLPEPISKRDYYRDAMAIAFPSPKGDELSLTGLVDRAESNGSSIDIALLSENFKDEGVTIQPDEDTGKAILELEFGKTAEIRHLSALITQISNVEPEIMIGNPGGPFMRGGNPVTLEVSVDGNQFSQAGEFSSGNTGDGLVYSSTANINPVSTKYMRIVSPLPFRISGLRISGAGRIDDLAAKTNFTNSSAIDFSFTGRENQPEPDQVQTINPETVIDISRYMNANGRLDWDAPEGNWTVLRFGYTTTGTEGHPMPDGGTGLECDKFSKEAIDFHFDQMFGHLMPLLEPLAERGMAGALIDSYEVGMQNWSENFPEEFLKRCGYDIRNYMPVITGRIVGSREMSERFLYDFRKSQYDTMAENYWGRFAELCRQHNMMSYSESYGGGPFQEISSGSRATTPMGEFWIGDVGLPESIKQAASIAHVYNKPVVGAESFTSKSKWQEYPYYMKAQGDLMYAHGLNQIIFHHYAHQPHPTAVPGMTFGPHGCHFTRTNTWFEKAGAWLDYAARCQYMLQGGVHVADLLYCQNGNVSVVPQGESGVQAPEGYLYDITDAESIIRLLQIKKGMITLPHGATYRLLVIQRNTVFTAEFLKKLIELVKAGMAILLEGPRPARCPGLAGYPENDGELAELASELWGDLDGENNNLHFLGDGRVYGGKAVKTILEEMEVNPDFKFTSRTGDAPVNYIHKRIGEADIYFVANLRRRPEELYCSFRVRDKMPEIWKPDTGEIIIPACYSHREDRTEVPVQLDPSGSVFVVFRNRSDGPVLSKITRNGNVLFPNAPFEPAAAELYPDVVNNFTINIFIKPDFEADLDIDGMDVSRLGGPDRGRICFVIFPPKGEELYGTGHAACGIMAGRNGVVVLERDRGNAYSSVVLVHKSSISGRYRLTLVYDQGKPVLYIDGRKAAEGSQSDKIVHPGTMRSYQGENNVYFEGDMSEPELYGQVMNDMQIAGLSRTGTTDDVGTFPAEFSGNGELVVWDNGIYTWSDRHNGEHETTIKEIDDPVELKGPWHVRFPEGSGAPASIVLPELISLHRHTDEGVKYFSGKADYAVKFDMDPSGLSEGKRFFLDLGRVEVIADVQLNGQALGTLWKPPYRADITRFLREGENELVIQVANLWPNRLIGDEHLPEEALFGGPEESMRRRDSILEWPEWYVNGRPKPAGGRVTFTTYRNYTKDSPLLESGLIGPVRIRTAVKLSFLT